MAGQGWGRRVASTRLAQLAPVDIGSELLARHARDPLNVRTAFRRSGKGPRWPRPVLDGLVSDAKTGGQAREANRRNRPLEGV